ncbi:MerR family transcriptional regulator [Flavobacteriaceae bacterium]|nr:MerR family transcriptional regulator [Flavobacteriaceae bacterium]
MNINLPEKRYYSIGEVAKAFGVNTSLLRYWEKEFKQIQPKKKSSGVRKFTPADIENIQLIHHLLKEKGMTIEGVKNHLSVAKDMEKSKLQLLNRLEKIKATLTSMRDNL